jgi:hypothetical protein
MLQASDFKGFFKVPFGSLAVAAGNLLASTTRVATVATCRYVLEHTQPEIDRCITQKSSDADMQPSVSIETLIYKYICPNILFSIFIITP